MLIDGNFMLILPILPMLIFPRQMCAGVNVNAFCMSGRRIFLSHICFSDNGNSKVGRQCVVIQSCQKKSHLRNTLQVIFLQMVRVSFQIKLFLKMGQSFHLWYLEEVFCSLEKSKGERESIECVFSENTYIIYIWAKISKSGKWGKSIFCDNFFKIGQK